MSGATIIAPMMAATEFPISPAAAIVDDRPSRTANRVSFPRTSIS